MNLYVIDTARVTAWQATFPASLHVCSATIGTDWQIGADDVVFAHTHENRVADNPDLVLALAQCGSVVIEFCQKVQEASNRGQPPRIILYSGGPVPLAQATYWKSISTGAVGPFSGVPCERIEVLNDAIPRHVVPDRLRDLVNAVLQRLRTFVPSIPANPNPRSAVESEGAGPATAIDKASTFSVADQLDRNAEAVLAARLIIDAAKHCGDHSRVDCHGVSIIRPDAGLVEAANQVVQAHQSRAPLDTAVQEFHSKLGFNPVP